MIIFVIHYLINDNSEKINIFKSNFVMRNKDRIKIIYNNKIIPFQTSIIIRENNNKWIKIKLICFKDNLDFNALIKGLDSFYKIYPSTKYKNNMIRFSKLKFFVFNSSYMIYDKLEPTSEPSKEIKIFCENFVINNKDKCLILFENKFFPLKEYFFLDDDKSDNEIFGIILLELDIISNKSFMFHECTSLFEFSLNINLNDILNLNEQNKFGGEKDKNIKKTNDLLNPIASSEENKNLNLTENILKLDLEKSLPFGSQSNMFSSIGFDSK